MNAARLRTIFGLAAAVVPCAIVVHLIAEAAALGRAAFDASFIVRHGYFVLLVAAAGWCFAKTVGLGCADAERRRRCALLLSELALRRGLGGMFALTAANVAFFGLTQAVEGVPIAAGALGLSLAVALAGSFATALVVVFFGRACMSTVLEVAIARAPREKRARAVRRMFLCLSSRRPTMTYSLLQPNRPPPFSASF